MAFFVPLTIGLGYAAYQFLFPASSTSATTVSGAEVGLTIKDFIKLAVDTNNLVLVDSNGNTIISPSSTGTMITGDVNVAVTTNTAQGYSLSVYTEDNSTSMVHSSSTSAISPVTDVIASIDTISGYNAETGAGELSANTWGFRNRTTAGLSNWFAVGENESNGTVIANTNTGNSLYCEALSYPLESTNCDAGSYDTHSVNFGAKVTDAIAAGTYTNNVVFSAVAKSEGTRYTLNFNPNGGNNTMGPRTIVKGSTITLPRTGFVKEGYAIKGWALTQADAEAKTANPSATTTNPTYSAGQTVEVTNLLLAAVSAGQAVEQNALINLYAIWDIAYTIHFNPGTSSATGTMPNIDTILSSNITIPNSGYTYEGYNFLGWAFTQEDADAGTVATVSGTSLEAGATVSTEALISAAAAKGQDISTTSAGTVQLYGVWKEAAKLFQTTNICSTLPTDDTSILRDNRDNQDYTVYRWGSSAPFGMSNYCIMTKDLSLGYVTGGSVTKDADLTLTTDSSAAADTIVAKTSTGDWSTSDSDDNRQYINGNGHSYYSYGAAQKVCPKGWRLPTQGEYNNIATFMGGNNSTGSSTIRSNPYNFVYGGYFRFDGWYTVGSGGYYWSSTQNNSTNGYNLYFNSSRLVTTINLKNLGFSVRCIMEPPTMQNTACSSLPEGQTSTLPDARDDQDYTIYRWPTSSGPSGMNGYCIMTKDLSLGYVTGGSVTKDTNLTLTADNSAAAATITARPNGSGWSTTNSNSNLQYRNGPLSGKEAYSSHSYYSYYAAQKVCPKGWRPPTDAEYRNITSFMGGGNSTGSSTIGSNPYNFVYGGEFYGSDWYGVGETGYYWSSTRYDSTRGYLLSFSSSVLGWGNAAEQSLGFSVRCIRN